MFDWKFLGLDGIDGLNDEDSDDGMDCALGGGQEHRYQLVDTNGDGMLDTRMAVEAVDLDGDGRPDVIAQVYDQNFDGNPDQIIWEEDQDGDGITDHVFMLEDTDGDQYFESQTELIDEDGDGIFESARFSEDANADGTVDYQATLYDADGDGNFDYMEETVAHMPDINYPGEEIDYPNFDPNSTDMEGVVGDPGEAMENWHLQETDSSCAVAAQEFVLEMLTGREFSEAELRSMGLENGWYSYEEGTLMPDVGKILAANGIEVRQSTGNSVNDLTRALSSGNGVVVGVDADEIWYGEEDDYTSDNFAPGTGANHAVQVIGIDFQTESGPMVILNDSGCPDGRGMMVPLDVFVDAWEDSGCFMVEAYA